MSCFCPLGKSKMEYLRHLEPWIASWNILLEPAYLLSNATEKLNGLKEDVLDLWRNDDWQIRLSWFLMACTAFNIIFIGIAWNIYGETISNMFFNKSRSPLHKRSKTNVLSSSMEDLIVKKIQWHAWYFVDIELVDLLCSDIAVLRSHEKRNTCEDDLNRW